jgi:hypothetical protein
MDHDWNTCFLCRIQRGMNRNQVGKSVKRADLDAYDAVPVLFNALYGLRNINEPQVIILTYGTFQAT